MGKQLKSVVIGAGGSGTRVFKNLLANPDISTDMILGVDDSGSSTGAILNTIYFMNFNAFVTAPRFGDKRRVLPMGDFRNNLIRLLAETRGEQGLAIANILDQRIGDGFNNIDGVFIDYFIQILSSTQINPDEIQSLVDGFAIFLKEYFNAHRDNYLEILERINSVAQVQGTRIEQLPAHSFGNLFVLFFFLRSNSNTEFFELFKEFGLVPENVTFHFLSETRHILEGQDEFGNVIRYEHNIDVAKTPIVPTSLRLRAIDDDGFVDEDNLTEIEPSPEIESLIMEADHIALSTGSLANLFPQAKAFGAVLKESRALITYIANFARTDNEVEMEKAIMHLYNLLQIPFVILLINNELSKNMRVMEAMKGAYRDQGKRFNDVAEALIYLKNNITDPSMRARILPILNLKDQENTLLRGEYAELRDDLGLKGVKHDSEEVEDLLILLVEIHKELVEREITIDMVEQYFDRLIGQLDLSRFKNSDFQALVGLLREVMHDMEGDVLSKFRTIRYILKSISNCGNLQEVLSELRKQLILIDIKPH